MTPGLSHRWMKQGAQEHEAGSRTADVCRKHGISSATFYGAKYGGLSVSEAKRLRALESENARAEEALCRRHARQRDAEGSAVKKMVTPAVKREAVVHLRSAFEVSERRACSVIEVPRMTVRYRSRRPDDLGLRERLRALAHKRRRFGTGDYMCCCGGRATW